MSTEVVTRERAKPEQPGSIGAPMTGVVIELRVQAGVDVKVGDALVVLSAMKMETIVSAPVSGKVRRIAVATGDSLAAGDLLIEIEPTTGPRRHDRMTGCASSSSPALLARRTQQ